MDAGNVGSSEVGEKECSKCDGGKRGKDLNLTAFLYAKRQMWLGFGIKGDAHKRIPSL